MEDIIKIGVDAFGGDYAPKEPVAGAVLAAKENPRIHIILIGRKKDIERELGKNAAPENISIQDASEVIEMYDAPAMSVRRKKNSSIVVGAQMLKDKKIDAFVSAGNTGAVVSAATLKARLLPGVERPGLAIVIPTLAGPAVMIDVGASIETKPSHLFQYAIMADAYYRIMWPQKDSPRIGLLNIGEEDSKGLDFHKKAAAMLRKSSLNFIGNVEGKHIYSGDCDIIIADGFVGNVALKISESVAEVVVKMFKREIKSSFLAKIGVLFMLPAFNQLKKRIDYSEYGGALLLGINGICVIGHGRSNAKAVKSAISVAIKEIEGKINERILEKLSLEERGDDNE